MAKAKTLVGQIRSMILQTDNDFDEHIKKYKCKPQDRGCMARVEFQTRLDALREVLKIVGRAGRTEKQP